MLELNLNKVEHFQIILSTALCASSPHSCFFRLMCAGIKTINPTVNRALQLAVIEKNCQISLKGKHDKVVKTKVKF